MVEYGITRGNLAVAGIQRVSGEKQAYKVVPGNVARSQSVESTVDRRRDSRWGGRRLLPNSQYLAFSPEWTRERTPSSSSIVLHQCSPTWVEIKHVIRQLTRETVLNSHFSPSSAERRLGCREGKRRMLSHHFLLKSQTGGGALRTSPSLDCLVSLKETV